jgi:dihydrofolate reductase
MTRPTLSVIAAVARHGAIGKDNALLARLPDDLKRFRRLTMGHPILMGRKTWDSLGRPLPGRRNIVITRQPGWRAEGAEAAASLDAALALAAPADEVFVIGGAEVYALALPRADRLLLTEIDAEFDADTFFPPWNRADFTLAESEAHRRDDGLAYRFTTWVRHPR